MITQIDGMIENSLQTGSGRLRRYEFALERTEDHRQGRYEAPLDLRQ